jgi:TIGR00730 family protein
MAKNISIFCGAHEGTNPNYALEAKKITALLSKKGVDVVFGGGNVGIMKIISDEAKDNNSKVTGITMESLHNLELTNPRIDDLVVTHSLLERKDEFMKRSDAFLVLPGGVGSLDELAEILASNQLGIINKPVGLLNTDGYYDHLIAWFEKAANEGFITQANLDELIITDNCEEMVERILEEKSESSNDWKGRLGLLSLSLEIRIPSSNNIHIGNAKKI